jgi:hypothetical protein
MSAFWPIWLGSSPNNNPAGSGQDASTNSNVLRQTYINGFLDVSSTSTFRYDVSINGNLFIAPNKKTYFGGDVSLGSRLFIASDASLSGNLYTNGNLTVGTTTFNNISNIIPTTLSFQALSGQTNPSFGQVSVSNNGQYMIIPNGSTGISLSTNYGASFSLISGVTGPFTSVTTAAQGNGSSSLPAGIGCISANGQYLYINSSSGNCYLSSNYGVSWTSSNPSGLPTTNNYVDSAMSATGSYILTAAYTGPVYLSSNNGSSFTAISAVDVSFGSEVTGQLGSVAMSSTGQYMLVASFITYGLVYLSNNFGATGSWTKISALTQAVSGNGYRNCSISANGQYMMVVGQLVWLSSNFGVTWTSLSYFPSFYYNGCSISSTGQYMWVTNQSSTYQLNYSTNYGTSWTTVTGLPSLNTVAVSGTSGSVLIASTSQAYLMNNFTRDIINISSTASFLSDVSVNGNLKIYGNLMVQQLKNVNVINTSVNNYQLVVTEDISLNGRLLVQQDASFGGNLIMIGSGTTGRLGIGTSTPAYPLDVNGQVAATSFNATSDYRIKDNIQPLSESFTLDDIKPVTFTNKLLKRQDIGVIAHELQEHYPYLVTGEKDGKNNQTVNYIGFIGILIHEVKQLKQQMKELKEEINKLNNDNI